MSFYKGRNSTHTFKLKGRWYFLTHDMNLESWITRPKIQKQIRLNSLMEDPMKQTRVSPAADTGPQRLRGWFRWSKADKGAKTKLPVTVLKTYTALSCGAGEGGVQAKPRPRGPSWQAGWKHG